MRPTPALPPPIQFYTAHPSTAPRARETTATIEKDMARALGKLQMSHVLIGLVVSF